MPKNKKILDLKELEKRLDEALASETEDSINSWLDRLQWSTKASDYVKKFKKGQSENAEKQRISK